jgi:outer membrane immunogenic protein
MSRRVSVLFAVAFSMGLAASADAQAPNSNPKRWNGPYIGANLGYGWADFGGDLTAVDAKGKPVYGGSKSYGIDADGAFGGIQAGYNRRVGNFFIGVEADLQTADIEGSATTSGKGFTYAASASTDWFGTARVRGGYATNAMLVYATGGLAFGGVQYDASFKTSKGKAELSSDETQVGFVLGAGVEFALRSNWSLKIEYQYLNFGSLSAEDDYFWKKCRQLYEHSVSADLDTDIHTIRVGLNYSFNDPPPRHRPLKP